MYPRPTVEFHFAIRRQHISVLYNCFLIAETNPHILNLPEPIFAIVILLHTTVCSRQIRHCSKWHSFALKTLLLSPRSPILHTDFPTLPVHPVLSWHSLVHLIKKHYNLVLLQLAIALLSVQKVVVVIF